MAIAKTSLGHTFSCQITFGSDPAAGPVRRTDTHQAVKKPLYYMRFGTYLPDDAIKLAYASADEIKASDNIVVIDRSLAAQENSPEFIAGEESFLSDSLSSFYRDVLFTDVFTSSIPSQPAQPLFYKHTLAANISVDSVVILDSSFQKISPYFYEVQQEKVWDEVTGIETAEVEAVVIYNDLQNSYDEETGELVVYYVQYLNPTNEIVTILLNNESVFHEATFSDIWSQTLKLKPWVKAYLVEQSGNYYYFTLPKSTVTYRARFQESMRLEAKPPVVDSKDVPWFIRITNGAFTHVVPTDVYSYKIAEFKGQQFNPLEPYKFIVREEVSKIARGLIRLEHIPTALADLPTDIIIKDRDNQTVLHALTTNTTKTGSVYYEEGQSMGVSWNTDKILSFDCRSGLVQLDVLLKDYYKIYATYYYKEEYYEYSLLNLNPLTNSEVLENFYVVYLVPTATANVNLQQEASIHFLRVDKDGIIRECSQDGTDGNPDLSAIVGTSYGRPDIGANSFLRDYSIEASEGQSGYTKRYLILAEISVKKYTSINEITILDDRVRGGGIKADQEQAAKNLNPEVSWYGDIGFGGGIPYPGKAVIIVKIPHCLLRDYGGRFSKDEVREVVKRHIGFGHYPVIRYYGIKPRVSIADVNKEEIDISWPSETSDCEYNVYYAIEGNRYTKHNGSLVSNNANGNDYSVDGLTYGLRYSIYVEAICTVACGEGGGGTGNGGYGPDGPNSSKVFTVTCLSSRVPEITTDTLGHEFTVTV